MSASIESSATPPDHLERNMTQLEISNEEHPKLTLSSELWSTLPAELILKILVHLAKTESIHFDPEVTVTCTGLDHSVRHLMYDEHCTNDLWSKRLKRVLAPWPETTSLVINVHSDLGPYVAYWPRFVRRFLDGQYGRSQYMRKEFSIAFEAENLLLTGKPIPYLLNLCRMVFTNVKHVTVKIGMRENSDDHEESDLFRIMNVRIGQPDEYIELYRVAMRKVKIPIKFVIPFVRYRAVCELCDINYEIWQRNYVAEYLPSQRRWHNSYSDTRLEYRRWSTSPKLVEEPHCECYELTKDRKWEKVQPISNEKEEIVGWTRID